MPKPPVTALAIVVLAAALALGACATRATKAFTVEVSPLSMQYTPGQIHDYLRNRGYQRVKFQDPDSGSMIYEKRSAESDEQHFRLKTYPQIEVIVRLEKIRHTFEKSNPRVIVWFREDGRNTLSTYAEEEYRRMLDEVIARVGQERVDVWSE